MTATDSAEVRAFHRPFYDEWRRRHRTEDLRNGIASLLEEHGYTMTDVSVMLGLTRERVRQFVARWGLVVGSKYTTAYRVWDDEANRFRPVAVAEYQRVERQKRTQARARWRRDRQRAMADRLWALAGELGYTPTVGEFATAWFGREMPSNFIGPSVHEAWDTQRRTTAAASTKALYEAAGLTVRASGSPGHRNTSPTRPVSQGERDRMMSLRRGGRRTIGEIALIVGRSYSIVWKYTRGYRHA